MDISIIVPIYNAEKTIERCLNSILKIRNLEYEVLLIDNNSTDKSRIICEKYVEKYEFIYCFNEKKQGVSSARNKGLKKIQGKYTIFVDVDDELYGHNILKCFQQSLEENADILICGVRKEIFENNIVVKIDDINLNNEVIIVKCTENYSVNEVWGKLFKTDIIKKNNLKFDESFNLGEDQDFTCRFLQCCAQIKVSNLILYHYIFLKGESTLSKKFYADYFNFIQIPNKSLFELYKIYEISDKYQELLSCRYWNDWWRGYLSIFNKNCHLNIKNKIIYLNRGIKTREKIYLKNLNTLPLSAWKIKILKIENSCLLFIILTFFQVLHCALKIIEKGNRKI